MVLQLPAVLAVAAKVVMVKADDPSLRQAGPIQAEEVVALTPQDDLVVLALLLFATHPHRPQHQP
jgi:hypothetical protein